MKEATVTEIGHRGGKAHNVARNLADTEAENDVKGKPQSGENAAKRHSPASEQVPRFTPMPIPVVEEPLTPSSDTQPNTDGRLSQSSGDFHPKTPSAQVSPVVAVQTTLMSSWSSVSSLHGGRVS